MTYVVTYIDVQPGSTTEAIVLINQYRETNSAEEGSLASHAMQENCRQNRFVIVEAWEDEPAVQVHERAEHTNQFRTRLRDIHNSPYDQRMHHGFAVDAKSGATTGTATGSLHVVTHVDVPPPRREETEVLLRSLAEQSRKDDGNLRYDVFQQNAPRTNHFTVFAVWKDPKVFASHEMKPHTRQFREALGPMLGAPYDERLYTLLFA